jgi:hypothetical protein
MRGRISPNYPERAHEGTLWTPVSNNRPSQRRISSRLSGGSQLCLSRPIAKCYTNEMRPLILACALVAMAITPLPAMESPHEPIGDKFLKEIAQVWTVVVDERNAKGAKLDDLFDVLAGDPFFDVREQARLHPNYSGYITNIAARRPSTIDPDMIVAMAVIILGKNRAAIDSAPKSIQSQPESAASATGGVLGILAISFGLPIWWLRFWNRRAERKMNPRLSIGTHYRALLLRMIWRYLVVLGSVVLLLLSLAASGQYTDKQMAVHALFFWALAFVCLGVVLVYSRTLTKRRFSQQDIKATI